MVPCAASRNLTFAKLLGWGSFIYQLLSQLAWRVLAFSGREGQLRRNASGNWMRGALHPQTCARCFADDSSQTKINR